MGEPQEPAPAIPPADSAEELYELAPCGYLTARPDGTIVRVNGTFLSWTGHAREELVGRRRFQDLLTPGGRIYHETHYAPLLRMQDSVREIALEIVCADGRRLPVLVNSALTRDAAGEPRLVRTAVFDATHRREYERELLRLRERERAARAGVERLGRLTARLSATLLPEQVAAAALEELAALFEPERAAIAARERGGGLRPLAAHGCVPAAGAPEPLAGHALGAEDGIVVEARAELPALLGGPAGGEGGWTLVALALGGADGEPAGVVCLAFAGEREPDAEERAFALACAAQCAQALERARLHAETAEAARRSALLAEMSRRLDEARTSERRAQRLAELAARELADAAWVELASGDTHVPVAAASRAPGEPAGDPPPAAEAAVARALSAGEPQVVEAGGGEPAGGSCAAVPLPALDRPIGVLVLASRPGSDRPLDREALPFLRDLAERAALALENARLYERERDVAHALQQSLLAGEPPHDRRFAVAARYRPAIETLEVGGDWHDTFALDGDRIGIVVGDVVGRGIHAASAMGQLRSALRALALADAGPARVLAHLDEFVEQHEDARLATLVYAEVDLRSGAVRMSSAGHLPPALIEPGAPARLLWDGRATPLGTFVDVAPRVEAELTLAPGATLVLYTDGLVERRMVAIDAGLDRLLAELDALRGESPAALVDRVSSAMLSDEHGRDDVCMLVFRLAGEDGAPGAAPAAERPPS